MPEISDISQKRMEYIITTLLDMCKLSARLATKFLNSDQPEEWVQTSISESFLALFKTERNILTRLMKKDETCL